MKSNRIAVSLSMFVLLGLAACNGEEDVVDFETQEVVTEPAVETVEVPVVTEDTAIIEREVDIDAEVDTVDLP